MCPSEAAGQSVSEMRLEARALCWNDTFILARQQGEWVVFGRWPLGTTHWRVTDGDLAQATGGTDSGPSYCQLSSRHFGADTVVVFGDSL